MSLNYEILYRGSFAMLKVNLKQGETIKAEAGAMVSMSPSIEIEGKLEGGILGGIGRMFSGEKFFFQTLKAVNGNGEVLLSPSSIGDIAAIELDGSTNYIVQKDGFFAAEQDIYVNTTMQNLVKGIFSGEGFFVLKISGRGSLFVSSYGAIHPIHIPVNNEVLIDNNHLVAWPETIEYRIEKAAKGWISTITSGEGLVCRFKGPGTVYIQTRNPGGFVEWIRQFIPAK